MSKKTLRPLQDDVLVDQIARDPEQPRKHFDTEKLTELADSIRVQGVIQPVLLRRLDTTDPERGDKVFPWRLISGERRWRASMIAGVETIPAVEVIGADDKTCAAIALVENAQRADLTPLETARHLKRLKDEFGYTLAELGEMMGGTTKGRVSKLLSVLNLPEPLHQAIELGTLTLRHAETLLQLRTADAVEWGVRAATEEWSSRELEARTLGLRTGGRQKRTASKPAAEDPDVAHLTSKLTEFLSSRVKLEPARKGPGGKLVIAYYDNDTLQGILQRIGFPTED